MIYIAVLYPECGGGQFHHTSDHLWRLHQARRGESGQDLRGAERHEETDQCTTGCKSFCVWKGDVLLSIQLICYIEKTVIKVRNDTGDGIRPGDQTNCDIPFIFLPFNPLTLSFTVSRWFQHELLQGDEACVFPGRHWACLSYRSHDSSGPRKRPAGRSRGHRQTVTD